MIGTRIVAFTVAVVLGPAGTAGCSGDKRQRSMSPAASVPAADPAVDYRDPAQVCGAFAAAVQKADTILDSGPGDAYQRAAPYADAALGAAIVDEQTAASQLRWLEWASHRAYVEVGIDSYAGNALPPEADGVRYQAVLVTAQPVGRDGWRGPIGRYAVFCSLRPVGDGWRISDYDIEELT
jgi:hypothetical protein